MSSIVKAAHFCSCSYFRMEMIGKNLAMMAFQTVLFQCINLMIEYNLFNRLKRYFTEKKFNQYLQYFSCKEICILKSCRELDKNLCKQKIVANKICKGCLFKSTHYKYATKESLKFTKVHKSKGRTLFVVYVQPSKNKPGHFRYKIHLFTLLPVFYLIQPSSKQIICFVF